MIEQSVVSSHATVSALVKGEMHVYDGADHL